MEIHVRACLVLAFFAGLYVAPFMLVLAVTGLVMLSDDAIDGTFFLVDLLDGLAVRRMPALRAVLE